MKVNAIPYLPKSFANKAIVVFIIVLGLCTIFFHKAQLPWLWVVFSSVEVLAFFFFTYKLTKDWASIPVSGFIRKLFLYSFFIRVVWVIFSYFFFIAQTGEPFDFVMADSYGYHSWAVAASDTFSEKGFGQFFESGTGYSDLGYPMYLTAVYLIFGQSIIMARLFFALWSALTCILIYKLARRNFGETAGRIAGIMAMLLPNFIYYTGLHLKEPLMVFLIVAFIERADYLLHGNRITIFNLVLTGLLGASLFFFRTVLGLSAIFALFSALVLSKRMTVDWMNRIIISFWFLLIIWFFLSARIQGEINYYITEQDKQGVNMQFRAAREGGNTLASYGTTVVFLPFMFMAPFPTFVNIEVQQQQMLLAGSYFVRNIYSFFVVLALILFFKRKILRKHILILSFIFAYLFILAKSSFAISERFHMPVVPFLLILAAYGITQINYKNKKYYIPYLIFVVILIIGWNWFKLAGRGVI